MHPVVTFLISTVIIAQDAFVQLMRNSCLLEVQLFLLIYNLINRRIDSPF